MGKLTPSQKFKVGTDRPTFSLQSRNHPRTISSFFRPTSATHITSIRMSSPTVPPGPDVSTSSKLVIVTSALYAVALPLYAFRMYSRLRPIQNLGCDDLVITIALVSRIEIIGEHRLTLRGHVESFRGHFKWQVCHTALAVTISTFLRPTKRSQHVFSLSVSLHGHGLLLWSR